MLFLTAAIATAEFEPAAWQAVESLVQRAEQVQVSNDTVESERGRESAAPEGFLVAGLAGQGLVNADSGLRGCLHKPSYTN